MPRKKSSTPALDTPDQVVQQGKYWLTNDAPWYGFINISLTDVEKDEFDLWYEENAKEVNTHLDDIIGEGMKYGCAYDRENECYIVTFTGCLMLGGNMRACVTSRAGNWAEANALSVWKHLIHAGGDYGDYLTTGKKRSWG